MKKDQKRDKAVQAATDVLKIKKAIKEMETQLDEATEVVREYVTSTGEMRLGDAMIFERKNAAKLIPARVGLDEQAALKKLIETIPAQYKETKTSLLLATVMAEMERDPALKRVLKKCGFTVQQDSSLQVKSY